MTEAKTLRAPVLITTSWDDGHPSDLRVADLLEKYGLSGTFYVPSANSESRPVMCAAEVAGLGRRFEIGGHTSDHVPITDLSPRTAADQIIGNKYRLEDILGRELCGFAYVRGRHNRFVRELVDSAGYRYARTGRNFMTSPGADRLQVPTTVQFFAHSRSVYARNYVSGRPTLHRTEVLAAMLGGGGLAERCCRAAEVCTRSGGYFHLWGHSWELDEHDLWAEIEVLFGHLRSLTGRFVTNFEWCASLLMSAQMRAPTATERSA